MSFVDLDTSTFTTGSDSAASFTTKALSGGLYMISYVRDSTATALSTNASLTVTAERSGLVALSVSAFTSTTDTAWLPRRKITSTAGSTIGIYEMLPLANERLTFTLSSGGASKGGTFRTFVV